MAFLIEKDESTANRRRVPFHLFASTGTGPFTSGSNITMLGSVNGAAQPVGHGEQQQSDAGDENHRAGRHLQHRDNFMKRGRRHWSQGNDSASRINCNERSGKRRI